MPKTIQLEKGFRRIAGSLDKEANNGETDIKSVTLAAHDGLFLVRE
jgi:hypothetical protein